MTAAGSDASIGGDPPCWAHLFEDDRDAAALPNGAVIADLGDVTLSGGAVWSLPHGGDLDANLVRLEPGHRIEAHVNAEVDVLVFVQSGTGRIDLGDTRADLTADHLVLVPRGVRRSIAAGPSGITYLSVHRRRGLLGTVDRSKAGQSAAGR
jgi:mannose-6-phosphate isomerase-like protein (cupin superfamily)